MNIRTYGANREPSEALAAEEMTFEFSANVSIGRDKVRSSRRRLFEVVGPDIAMHSARAAIYCEHRGRTTPSTRSVGLSVSFGFRDRASSAGGLGESPQKPKTFDYMVGLDNLLVNFWMEMIYSHSVRVLKLETEVKHKKNVLDYYNVMQNTCTGLHWHASSTQHYNHLSSYNHSSIITYA